jgi:cytoskeleton protein RodZ
MLKQMSQDEYHPWAEREISLNKAPDAGGGENGSSGNIGIGQLLRNAREKRGIGYEEICEKTRVRPHILEALENEDWAQLPPRVIVKGFIRSYARALELEEGEIVGLYQKAFPVETSLPTPREAPIQSGRNLIIFLAFLLLTMGFAVYLLQASFPPGRGPVTSGMIGPKSDKEIDSGGLLEASGKTVAPPSVEKEETTSSLEADQVPENSILPPLWAGDDIPFHLEGSPAPEPEKSILTLTGAVKAMTWIKVFVDDQGPKEYIFQAGERFEWEARKGFDVIIGNAGGVDLVFEGKEIVDLGDPGQVIRVRFPENHER